MEDARCTQDGRSLERCRSPGFHSRHKADANCFMLQGTQITGRRRSRKPGSGTQRWWHHVTGLAPRPRTTPSRNYCPASGALPSPRVHFGRSDVPAGLWACSAPPTPPAHPDPGKTLVTPPVWHRSTVLQSSAEQPSLPSAPTAAGPC